uniref:U3 small nucleolar RNAassociated protein putative n=1 Tax=Albugo laibachii Nc14 TaxID=890382 RepID=F0W107_9STRA|nr:U3 small nucleolar RNAassociated protein putative [Albugo laibachii Nc14]|eukprot:CCA14731.1 U3 small nucleolar RNAassociated protein putative [Albugo laibachii Nc14]
MATTTPSTAGEFKRLVLKQFPPVENFDSTESSYWKKFNAPEEFPQVGPVSHIDVSPEAPNDVAITTSARVHIYNMATNQITKTFSRFRDIVYSGNFRSDGKLLVVGGKLPQVQIIDIQTRAILRNLQGHSRAVHCTQFAKDNVHVFSCSDDNTARYWDVATGTPIALFGQHSDHVRHCCNHPTTLDVWATASYDHTIRLWDIRTADSKNVVPSTMSVDHGAPVEACMILPGGGMMMSAGGNEIKVWDILSGGRLMHTFSSHQKTITSLGLDGTKTRIISGALDGHVKIYDMKTYQVLYGFKTQGGVLSMGMSPTNSHLFTGTTDGLLTVRRRHVKKLEAIDLQTRKTVLRHGSYRYFLQAKQQPHTCDDFRVVTTRQKRIAPYDRALRKFDYKYALDEALSTRCPNIVASMLEELRLRLGLKRAIAERDEEALEPLLAYLVKYVTDPKYASLLRPICSLVCDLYASKLCQSNLIDQLFVKLHEKINEELRAQKEMMSLVGMLDLIIACPSNNKLG